MMMIKTKIFNEINFVTRACCTVLLMLVHSVPAYALEVNGYTPDKTVDYKTAGTTQLKLHIFNPEGHKSSDQCSVIVFFFGGGWSSGSPSQFHPHCEYLASRGMVAMAAEYRVKSRHNTTPAECVEDGKSAIRWIRQHASELGIDPNKVIAGGGSAGGQVAAATGTLEGFNGKGDDLRFSARPNALVLFNPVFDNSPGGYGYDRVEKFWKDFSPMHNISEKTPPTIVFFGTKDRLIPVSTAEKYKKIMEDHGCRCDLFLYPDQIHGFFNVTNKKYYDVTVKEMDRFLVSLGYLKADVIDSSSSTNSSIVPGRKS